MCDAAVCCGRQINAGARQTNRRPPFRLKRRQKPQLVKLSRINRLDTANHVRADPAFGWDLQMLSVLSAIQPYHVKICEQIGNRLLGSVFERDDVPGISATRDWIVIVSPDPHLQVI